MRKFINRILIFLSLFIISVLIAIVFHIFIIGNQYGNQYTGIFQYKMGRLVSMDGPKIVLVGDSNVAYGINSELIEKEFNIPVVNLGLHGGLGEKFHVDMAKANIQEGDIVIYAGNRYDIYSDIDDIRLAWITVEFNSKYYKYVLKGQEMKMILTYPNYFYNALIEFIKGTGAHTGSPESLGFNEYGDVSYFRALSQDDYFFEKGRINIPKMSDEEKKAFNELNEYVKAKGAILLIAGYPIGYDTYISDEDKEILSECKDSFQEGLNCIIISDYEDYLFSYEYFYDSEFHLGTRGSELRTKQLIKDLKESGVIN